MQAPLRTAAAAAARRAPLSSRAGLVGNAGYEGALNAELARLQTRLELLLAQVRESREAIVEVKVRMVDESHTTRRHAGGSGNGLRGLEEVTNRRDALVRAGSEKIALIEIAEEEGCDRVALAEAALQIAEEHLRSLLRKG